MENVVIVDTIRTPMGRSKGGCIPSGARRRSFHPHDAQLAEP